MTLPSELIRPEIAALSAYHVPPSNGLIKLDAMENPYTWPQAMREKWQDRVANIALNRYPDPHANALKESLRNTFAIPQSQSLLLGNGSDEIIQLLAMALAKPGAKVLAPEPGFVMYRMIATFTGMQYVGVPLNGDDFSLDMPAMREAIGKHDPALIFIAYPNNPTANLFDDADIDEIISLANGLVVIDEAYFPFAERSYLAGLEAHPNLLVMRTVSKMGLAGLRLGYLIGDQQWLHEFEKVRMPYNINVMTQAAAEFALAHADEFDRQAAEIRDERTRVGLALAEFEHLQVFPSAANFILVRVNRGAQVVFDHLLANGILIKNLATAGGALDQCLRITVGTPEENDALLSALASAV
ncbi:MAG: histidinol-phosphate transaminase [Pseudomonadota bacterium]